MSIRALAFHSARSVFLFSLLTLVGTVGCFDFGEPRLTAEDLAWSSEDLTSVTVFAATRAVVVSAQGSAYHSDDAGLTWRRSYADGEHPLYSVTIGADGRGYAVGDAAILETRDGGRTWSSQTLPAERNEAKLRSLARVDSDHVIAVGLAGARIVTTNGGVLWRDRSAAVASPGDEGASAVLEASLATHAARMEIPRVAGDADLQSVVCRESAQPFLCLSFGARGGTAYSEDGGESWVVSRIQAAVDSSPLEMDERGVELRGAAKEQLKALVEDLTPRESFQFEIEAVASEREIERVAHAKDPEALFEILELRGNDARTILEEVGIDSNSIHVLGAPPWDFGDVIDEDREILDRYFERKRAKVPGLLIHVSSTRPLMVGAFMDANVDLALHADEDSNTRVIASDGFGTLWQSTDSGHRFARLLAQRAEPARSVFASHNGVWLARPEGLFQAVGFEGPETPQRPLVAGTEITERTFRAVDFSPNDEFGLIVGDRGVILRRSAQDSPWELIQPGEP